MTIQPETVEPMTPMESAVELARREGRIPRPSLNGDDPYGVHAARDALFARDVEIEADKLRVRAEARRQVRAESAGPGRDPTPHRLDDFLAVADPPQHYRLEGLWPLGGRTVLAAAFKAGKTTLMGNVLRSLVDGEPFLGHFAVTPVEGTVVLIDDELDERTLRRWLREQGIKGTDRVVVIPIRGRTASFDLLDETIRRGWAAKLKDWGAAVLLVDCLRPMLDAAGLAEGNEAGRWLEAFDALLVDAGVSEAGLVHHMGHVMERSRGDSRILDWPDVTWNLVRELDDDNQPITDGKRYFSAYGRDVEISESELGYDAITRRLTIAGGTRKDAKADAAWPAIEGYLRFNPGSSQRAVEVGLAGVHARQQVRKALARAIDRGDVDSSTGPRNAVLHFLRSSSAPSAP